VREILRFEVRRYVAAAELIRTLWFPIQKKSFSPQR